MIRTIKVKLNLSEFEIQLLREMQKIAADIFNDHVDWCFARKTFSKALAHKELYYLERTKFPEFNSAMIQTVRDTALESVKALKFKFKPRKSPNSGIRYDKRIFDLRGEQLTLSTSSKRIRTIITFPSWCKNIVETGKLQQLQLTWNKKAKKFYAGFVFKFDDVKKRDSGNIVGLDRGLINLVTTSEGEIFKATKVRKNQRKFLYLRKKLSIKGTHSAKRLLKKLSGKEKRFNREQNHILAKHLASNSSVKTYVIEDLKGIRSKNKGRKMNKLLSSWAFFELESMLSYKCEVNGISVEKVDARYTSQRCSCCGEIRKANRKGGKYHCNKCGYTSHADINAAINIRDRFVSTISQPQKVEQGTVNCPIKKDGSEIIPRYSQDPKLQTCIVII